MVHFNDVLLKWPECHILVHALLQAQREYPGNLAECKDKFLVQWVKVDNDVKDVLPDAFDAGKNKEIKQSKLRVTLVRAVRSWEGCSPAVADMLQADRPNSFIGVC